MDKAVAIIPARGGSKRIPNKNTKAFHGRPIISYSIAAAKDSDLFDRILVSTDSDDVASVAENYGAEAPFRRPASLSDDLTPVAPVVEHALRWLSARGEAPTLTCCLYATAPFVTATDLLRGRDRLEDARARIAIAVAPFTFPVQRALRIATSGSLEMLWPEHELTRSNDLPEAYHDAGQFYWLRTSDFLAHPRIYQPDAQAVVVPAYRVQDIDTPDDWRRAELIFSAWSVATR